MICLVKIKTFKSHRNKAVSTAVLCLAGCVFAWVAEASLMLWAHLFSWPWLVTGKPRWLHPEKLGDEREKYLCCNCVNIDGATLHCTFAWGIPQCDQHFHTSTEDSQYWLSWTVVRSWGPTGEASVHCARAWAWQACECMCCWPAGSWKVTRQKCKPDHTADDLLATAVCCVKTRALGVLLCVLYVKTRSLGALLWKASLCRVSLSLCLYTAGWPFLSLSLFLSLCASVFLVLFFSTQAGSKQNVKRMRTIN